MRVTTVTIKHPDNTTYATGLLVQVDQTSDKSMIEHAAIGDHHVGDLFTITTLGWNPSALIRRGDVLLDERFTDEDNKNGATYRYRIVSRPKNYDLHHQVCVADTAVGT
jgi:hypothetical protein